MGDLLGNQHYYYLLSFLMSNTFFSWRYILSKMESQFARSELVLGPEATAILEKKKVAVFGLGGVGSFAVEALARSGIGSFLLVDSDVICLTNLNRQLFATHSAIGRAKTEAARDRVLDINPAARVALYTGWFQSSTVDDFDFGSFDYVVDCIDTVSAKLLLVERCRAFSVPLVSSMGTGNKRDPSRFEFADISETSVCPLARVMRREIAKRGLGSVRVLYSREDPAFTRIPQEEAGSPTRKVVPGSLPWVPSVAGLMLAGDVVLGLLQGEKGAFS